MGYQLHKLYIYSAERVTYFSQEPEAEKQIGRISNCRWLVRTPARAEDFEAGTPSENGISIA
jgi:hypothetical protein